MENIEYEAEYEEGLTFKKVWHFCKKGWLRALIYVCAAALLACAVALPIRSFYKAEPVAQTTVEFMYSGVEKGLAPDGSLIDMNELITRGIVENAVHAANLESVVPDVSKLREKMRVEPVATDEYVALVQAAANGDKDAENTLRNYVMHPTKFMIVISDHEALGLGDDQAKQLLDQTVVSYIKEFERKYASRVFSDYSFELSADENYEFTTVAEMYSKYVGEIKSIVNDLAVKSVASEYDMVSAKYANIINEATSIESMLDTYTVYVLSEDVWRDKALAKKSLEYTRAKLENTITVLEEQIKSLSEQIASFAPNIDKNDSTIIIDITYPQAYYDLQNKLTATIEEKKQTSVDLFEVGKKLDAMGQSTENTPAEKITEAKEKLAVVEKTVAEFMIKAQVVVDEYYDVYTAQSVKHVQQPIVTRRTLSFSLKVVLFVAIVLGFAAACVVTGIKIHKKNKAQAQTAATTDEQPSDATDKKEDK